MEKKKKIIPFSWWWLCEYRRTLDYILMKTGLPAFLGLPFTYLLEMIQRSTKAGIQYPEGLWLYLLII